MTLKQRSPKFYQINKTDDQLHFASLPIEINGIQLDLDVRYVISGPESCDCTF